MDFTKTLESSLQTFLTGVLHMDSGQAKPRCFSQLTLDGCSSTATLCSCTTCSQDSKELSQDISMCMQMTMKVLWTIGYTSTPRIKCGNWVRRCTDGSDGTTALMWCWPINQRQDGTMFLTEVSILTRILLTVSSLLSTFIIITWTLMLTKSQDKKEEWKELVTVNSCRWASSHPERSGESGELLCWPLAALFK